MQLDIICAWRCTASTCDGSFARRRMIAPSSVSCTVTLALRRIIAPHPAPPPPPIRSPQAHIPPPPRGCAGGLCADAAPTATQPSAPIPAAVETIHLRTSVIASASSTGRDCNGGAPAARGIIDDGWLSERPTWGRMGRRASGRCCARARSSTTTASCASSGRAGWARSTSRATRASGGRWRSSSCTRASAARERFLAEAQATATFNHPHIVTVYGVGEAADGTPYLALEYVAGQTLAQRLTEERPSLREAMRVALAIAEALEEAHRHGILHRDLKPANVLVASDGRLRVVDFGIAKVLGRDDEPRPSAAAAPPDDGATQDPTESRAQAGTPAYMAPEQWRDEESTPATDVWALGVILHELVYGSHPYDAFDSVAAMRLSVSSPRAPVPIGPAPNRRAPVELERTPELAALIARCLDKDPTARPRASDVRATLGRLLDGGGARALGDGRAESPFRGLLPFTEQHAALFFGRDAEIAAFLERLRDEPLLPVVGPSGAGKSSFVQAGVVPRLRDQGSWTVLELRPGTRPFHALAQRLLAGERSPSSDHSDPTRPARRVTPARDTDRDADGDLAPASGAPADVDALAAELATEPARLALALRQRAVEDQARVLLYVDQLEELYTLVADPELRRRFMAALAAAADDREDPVRVCFSVRDDFLGRLADGAGARDALSRLMVLRAPGREALTEILTRPLAAVGFRYDDPALVGEMIDAVGEEPACLPLLGFASRALWERRDRERRLVTRAAYVSIGGVAGALASHADGVVDGLPPREVPLARALLLRLVTPEGTRRVLPESRALEGLGDEGQRVLARLTEARLVSVRRARGDERAEAELELAHESLISTWPTLARWIEAGRDDLALAAELAHAAELWERHRRDPEHLWPAATLDDATRALARLEPQLPPRERAFLEASRAQSRRRARRRRALLVGGGVLLAAAALVALVVAYAFAERDREARHRWAEAQREAARAALGRGEPLEARAQLRGSLETEDSTLARALWGALERDPLVWRRELGSAVYQVAWSPDGLTVAAACQDQTVVLIDARTLTTRALRGIGDQVTSVVFSPDGKRLAAGTWSGIIALWELPAGGQPVLLRGHGSSVWGIAFTPDGKTLVTGSQDHSVRLWDVERRTQRALLAGHGAEVNRVAVSASGRTIASSSYDHTVRLWELPSGRLLRVLGGYAGAVVGVAFTPDERFLATGSWDQTVRLWDLRSDGPARILGRHGDPVYDVQISPDGTLLATGSADKTIRLWSLPDGEARGVLRGHGDRILNLDFSPDGTRLVSGGYDNTVRVWDPSVRPARTATAGHSSSVVAVAFSPDGARVATASYDQTVGIWDTATGRMRATFSGHTHRVYGVVFSPDGKWVASASGDKTVRVWGAESGITDKVLFGHTAAVYGLAVSPDGARLASSGSDGTAILWDVAAGRAAATLRGHTDRIYDVRFSPDGRSVATGSYDNSARVWDAATGRERRVLRGHTDTVAGVAFSPDGARLATGGEDRTLRLWDLATGRGRVVATLPGRIYRIAFHPDGRRIAASCADGIARIVDVESGAAVALTGHRGEVNDVAFSADGATVATVSDDRTLQLWDVATGRPRWRAPILVGPEVELYTHRGWQRLDGGARPVDPAPPAWRHAVEEAELASASPDDSVLCVQASGRLGRWDRAGDRRAAEVALASPRQLLAGRRGCLALDGAGAVTLLPVDGEARRLILGDDPAARAEAIAWDGDEILVALATGGVTRFAADGSARGHVATEAGVTAIARSGDELVVGYGSGALERVPLDPRRPRPRFSFEAAPSSPVVTLAAGPLSTVLAGYANGFLGQWHLANGSQLEAVRLHGPVEHLRVDRARLYAATRLGDDQTLDLSVFDEEYCALLRRVWCEVPVVWEGGLLVERKPPARHRCAARR